MPNNSKRSGDPIFPGGTNRGMMVSNTIRRSSIKKPAPFKPVKAHVYEYYRYLLLYSTGPQFHSHRQLPWITDSSNLLQKAKPPVDLQGGFRRQLNSTLMNWKLPDFIIVKFVKKLLGKSCFLENYF